jgi:pyruvate formate lyase activating enzyme
MAAYDKTGAHGTVFNIMRYSVADGPGLRTTVFLKGCPLRCVWCHNPESQAMQPQFIHRVERCLGCGDCIEACPQRAISRGPKGLVTDYKACLLCGQCLEACPSQAREIFGRQMSVDEVMDEVIRDLPFFEQSGGGVTFSGGEPLMQPEFMLGLLKACREEEIHTALDTSGCVSYEVFQRVAPYVDLYLYDLKTMDPVKHKKYVGIDNQIILQNLTRLVKDGKRVLVRIPLIPGINDNPGDMERTGDFLLSLDSGLEVELLPYHCTASEKYRLLGMKAFVPPVPDRDADQLLALANILKLKGLEVHIGGKDDEPACSQAS